MGGALASVFRNEVRPLESGEPAFHVFAQADGKKKEDCHQQAAQNGLENDFALVLVVMAAVAFSPFKSHRPGRRD